MNNMFSHAVAFNHSIDSWDMSSVQTVSGMFYGATSFNQPIGNWDMSSVTSTAEMFRGASAFNQPLAAWNVSSVLSMDAMFYDATSFNQSLRSWCVSQITTRPTPFAVGANLSLEFEPQWGICPVPEPPAAVPASTPESAPVSVPESAPTSAPESAPIAAPVSAPIGTPTCASLNSNGVCVIQGNFSIPGDKPVLVINSSTIINGSLILNPNVTIQLQSGAVLNVTGCVVLSGDLRVLTDAPIQIVTGQVVPALLFAGGYCNDEKTQFNSTTITLAGAPECASVPATRPEYTSFSVSLLFDFDVCGCSESPNSSLSGGAIAGIVIAIVVVLGILIAFVVIVRFRNVIRPFAQRNDGTSVDQRSNTL